METHTDERSVDSRPSHPGTLERYTLLDRLGVGGMGEVYAAYDRTLDRKVALKFLRGRNQEHAQRMLREARVMARLTHPNVVQVFDVGVVDGRLFIAMEYVDGPTLREWQSARRSPAEVVRIYRQAGKGLAAAHAAGVVHRDFKPENVLVSGRGQPKVTDFGIARAVATEEIEPAPPEADGGPPSPASTQPDGPWRTPAGRLTEDGTIVGTLGYMAPEQYLCEPVDERCDQFSFCVSLYEALYREHPFAKPGAEATAAAVLGHVRDPPKGTSVPTWVRRVLVRGLSVEADERFSSMETLVAELRRDPAGRRRRWAGAGAIAALSGALAVFAWRGVHVRDARPCDDGEAAVAEVWDDAARQRVEASLLGTRAPYAADTWQRTRAEIDQYLGRWSRAYRRACEATLVSHSQPESVMTARMACLQQRRATVGALVTAMTSSERELAGRALPAAMDLPPLDACDDVQSLMSAEPEPREPERRAEIAAVREGLAEVNERVRFTQYDEARARAAPLVARARQVGYRPVVAEALLASSRAKGVSAPLEECIAEGAEAFFVADAARADVTRAEAAIWLADLAVRNTRPDDTVRWEQTARSVLDRLADDGVLRARLLEVTMRWRAEQGRFRLAADAARAALEAGRRAGASPLYVARLEVALAKQEAALGDAAASKALLEAADAALVRSAGEDHPERIYFFAAASYAASVGGDHQRALEATLRAIDLASRVAPSSDRLPAAHCNACWELHELRRDAEALPYCLKAIDLSLALSGADSGDAAYAQRDTGDVLSALGRYDEAIAHFDKTIAIYERVDRRGGPNYVYALRGVGKAHLLAGHPAEAVAPLRRALLASRTSDLGSREWRAAVADVELTLARALWAAGARDAEPATLAREAAQVFDQIELHEESRGAAAWLTEVAGAK